MSTRGRGPRGYRAGRGGRVLENTSTRNESEDRADNADSTSGGPDTGRGFADRGGYRGRPPNQSRPSGSPQTPFGVDEHTSGDLIFR